MLLPFFLITQKYFSKWIEILNSPKFLLYSFNLLCWSLPMILLELNNLIYHNKGKDCLPTYYVHVLYYQKHSSLLLFVLEIKRHVIYNPVSTYANVTFPLNGELKCVCCYLAKSELKMMNSKRNQFHQVVASIYDYS